MKNFVTQRKIKNIIVNPKIDSKACSLTIILVNQERKTLVISNLDFFLQEFDDAQKVNHKKIHLNSIAYPPI